MAKEKISGLSEETQEIMQSLMDRDDFHGVVFFAGDNGFGGMNVSPGRDQQWAKRLIGHVFEQATDDSNMTTESLINALVSRPGWSGLVISALQSDIPEGSTPKSLSWHVGKGLGFQGAAKMARGFASAMDDGAKKGLKPGERYKKSDD